MTTTDAWREVHPDGTVHLHHSNIWVLVELSGDWCLIGGGGGVIELPVAETSRALKLLLASRVADQYIAAHDLRNPTTTKDSRTWNP